MDTQTLLAGLNFSHQRLLGTLDAIEKSGQDPAAVLAWRPGPGRAHIGWQAMHCAATHDRYLNAALRNQPLNDPAHVTAYGGGSTPSDQNIPTFSQIREKLANNFETLRSYVAGLTPDDLQRMKPGAGGQERSIGDSIVLLTWHEAHHQGQIHLTWNLYKQAHGIA